jgi:hypothetical protein
MGKHGWFSEAEAKSNQKAEESRREPYCRLRDLAPGFVNAMRQKFDLGDVNSIPKYLLPSR